VVLATAPDGQGFSGLGSEADGFRLPDPEHRFTFPADHGAHPGFRIEWWYITANLRGADGHDYGVQWTLFRSALAPDDDPAPIWMGHAGLTTPDRHFAAERFARGGTGQAGVVADPFEAWIDEWRFTGIEQGALRARGETFGFDLRLETDRPFVPQGAQGYSVKAATGQASHYYSQPFYTAQGVLELPEGPVEVTGQAWLDREWSSQPLASDQTGWDWMSLHLEGGEKLMGFRLRAASGDYTTGTWIDADGTPTPLVPGGFEPVPRATTAIAGAGDVPTRWQVRVPSQGVDVTVEAINPEAWMGLTVSYWEGPVRVSGSHHGVGYLEMTGYD
jgi:predicted secreted hydrolase